MIEYVLFHSHDQNPALARLGVVVLAEVHLEVCLAQAGTGHSIGVPLLRGPLWIKIGPITPRLAILQYKSMLNHHKVELPAQTCVGIHCPSMCNIFSFLQEHAVRRRHGPGVADEGGPAEGHRVALHDQHGLPRVLVHLHHAPAHDPQAAVHPTAR